MNSLQIKKLRLSGIHWSNLQVKGNQREIFWNAYTVMKQAELCPGEGCNRKGEGPHSNKEEPICTNEIFKIHTTHYRV